MLCSKTSVKLYKAGVIDARAMSSLREAVKAVLRVTTTNNNPTSVALAAPVSSKKLLQFTNMGPFPGTRRDGLN